MKIIKPSHEIISPISRDYILKSIEKFGRTCYKSEGNITGDSASRFVEMLINKGHESVLEHISISVKLICSRACSHQLVRHRIASYSQESQRFCNYSHSKFDNQLTFIKPYNFEVGSYLYDSWRRTVEEVEHRYFDLIKNGAKTEDARSILPNSCKTEVVVTMNLRSWRHFLKIRTDKHAQIEIRLLALNILKDFYVELPEIFKDIVGG